jgi:hypothetical protein
MKLIEKVYNENRMSSGLLLTQSEIAKVSEKSRLSARQFIERNQKVVNDR